MLTYLLLWLRARLARIEGFLIPLDKDTKFSRGTNHLVQRAENPTAPKIFDL